MIVVSLPSLGVLTALSIVAGAPISPSGSDGWIGAILMMARGSVGILGIAHGVQYLQVRQAFRQEVTLHTTER